MILPRLVDTFFSRISLIMPLFSKSHNTAYVLPWEEGFHQFFYFHLLCIITVMKELRLYSGLHVLVACIIMAVFFGTVHALMDMMLADGLLIGLAGIMCPLVTVDDSTFQPGISSQGIFPCMDA